MSDGSMAYPYDYLEGSLVPLPIYAPQHAPCSIDNSDTPFEEWPAAAAPRRPPTSAENNLSNEPYHRYTSNIGYLNHWHPPPPLGLPGLIPQFNIPPPDQWQVPTSPTALHMAPDMEPGQFYHSLITPTVSSSLPLRGTARPPMAYEEYDKPHDWKDPNDSLPRILYRNRKSTAPNSSRARADPLRSSRPRTSRTMLSRPKQYVWRPFSFIFVA
jgi:hypothetical protein